MFSGRYLHKEKKKKGAKTQKQSTNLIRFKLFQNISINN